jgi:photosystem II stability/assembly factor-like uncharacterized protein
VGRRSLLSYRGERSAAGRGLAALAGILLAGAYAWPWAAQVAREDERGSIRQMERLGAEKGWVLTDATLLFTSDGGTSWSVMASGTRLEGVTDVFFSSTSRAYLAGVASGALDRLMVLGTVNGGASWREQVVEGSALGEGQVYARARVCFVDAAHGWLLGEVATSAAFSLGELLRTSDGGATWERLPRPPAVGRFTFVDAERGFMTGAPVSERLYRTVDGGRSWQELSLPVSAATGMALYDLPTFHSPNRGGVAVTLRGEAPRLLTFVTEDGGDSWKPADSLPLPAGGYDEPVPVALSASGRVLAFAVRGFLTLATDSTSRTFSLTRQDRTQPAPVAEGAVSVRALSLTEDGSCWVLAAEGDCEGGVCRQVTRLVAVDGSKPADESVEDLLVRTEEEVQTPPALEPAGG